MKMSGTIRVKTEPKWGTLFADWKKYCGEFHQLFFLAACVGYRAGERTPLKRGDERFWSSTVTPEEWVCFYAMLLEDNGFDWTSSTDENALAIAEQYANVGLSLLVEHVLGDYMGSKKEAPSLDSSARGLPREVVSYVRAQSSSSA